VLEALLELYPQAEIYTLIFIPEKISLNIKKHKIHTSFLQKIPKIDQYYRHFLPLMPLAISLFSLKKYDLIISSSHCVAKGINKPKNTKHISYIHAPMRYMWDRFEDYFSIKKVSPFIRAAALFLRPFLQKWDYLTAQPHRTDRLIANSTFIQSEIQKFYNQPSHVIHPFVDFKRFQKPKSKEGFYLMVGAFAPNKRTDLAIRVCNALKRNLKIIGSGQEEQNLKKIAGPTIEFLGPLENKEIEDYFSKAKAFLFPGKEDFGITPLESLASGTPVIAFGEGGVLDSLTNDTSVFFYKQDPESLTQALLEFENKESSFTEEALRKKAESFSKENFQIKFLKEVEALF